MEALKEKILKEGTAIGTQIVKVDGFINHQIDVKFMEALGKEFGRRFGNVEVDKILTVEASGIAIACLTAPHFNYPRVVFAKKTQPSTMVEDTYGEDAKSFTKGTVSTVRVGKQFLCPGDKVLILDDFLAHGEAAMALTKIVEKAGGTVVGLGTIIEKGFQGGGDKLRSNGYRVESLAIVEKIEDGVITFRTNNRE